MLKQDGQHKHTPLAGSSESNGVESVRTRAVEVAGPIFDALYNFGFKIGEQRSGIFYPVEPHMAPETELEGIERRIRAKMPSITGTLQILQGDDEDRVGWMRAVLATRTAATSAAEGSDDDAESRQEVSPSAEGV
jgi:hypothetical protein